MRRKFLNAKVLNFAFIFAIFIFGVNNVWATEIVTNEQFYINLDEATIARGYTVAAFDDDIKLSLVPGILASSTGVDILKLHEEMVMPWQVDKISDIYQFEFRNKAAYDNHKPFYIQLSYNEDDDRYKQVFYYDKNFSAWRPLPTRDFPDENFVRSLIHLPFARIAIFSYPNTLINGKASWYAYKSGNFAASPDYPKGSKLRVHNKANGKYVDVVVNDYGPDRSLFPDRPIDLDKVAFAQIASLGAGVIDVVVEPLYIVPDEYGNTLGVGESAPANISFNVEALSGVIMDEKTEEIIWSKDADIPLPLASLTKLVSMKVFMETEPDLEEIVKYSTKDKELNYEFCEPKYSIAGLDLKDGQKITIKDLLYSSIIASTNNTIETLVRVSGLKREDFISRMNDRVKEWGASSTVFYDPTGLAPQNVSSAQDYAIITKEVLLDPIIYDASKTVSYSHPTKDKTIYNTNNLLRWNMVHNISGSKTGYLIEAGHCLMIRVGVEDNNLIFVTFGSKTRDQSMSEMQRLVKYGLQIYKKKIIK